MSSCSPPKPFKLDLATALSQLDDGLTDAESWELYAAVEMGAYGEALARMRELARDRAARDAEEVLAEVERRALAGSSTL